MIDLRPSPRFPSGPPPPGPNHGIGARTSPWRGPVGILASVTLAILPAPARPEAPAVPPPIVVGTAAAPRVRFAAREVQRYVYVRTGALLPIATAETPPAGPAILIASRGRPPADAAAPDLAPPPVAGAYGLRSVSAPSGAVQLWIIGADDLGALYGAYRYAEKLGVRFYLHGDVVPDTRTPLSLAGFDDTGTPLFSIRGVQPFHDFAEGPDWWNADDYRAILGQMAKLRMNFLGLHTYPEDDVGPEPAVWIGLPGDDDARGRVAHSDPASWHTTGRGGHDWWGYTPLSTSTFAGGAAALFDRDDYGAEVMAGPDFQRQTEADANAVFNRVGDLWRTVFAEAGRLGIKTCLGTETPLTIPRAVADRLRRAGRDPADPAVRREVYGAMFARLVRTAAPDYYWLWTPENWTWEGNDPKQFAATVADIRAALGALDTLGHPFTLATCGWVLGPQNDRAALDAILPPECPMSCISQAVGYQPVERLFANVRRRPKWAIPWLENDGELTQPQLWAGRMRFDAADARRLGCTGLIGIHWRTSVIAPNVAALADAAWDQSWIPASYDRSPLPPQTSSGAIGGGAVAAPPLAEPTAHAFVYESVREGMAGYDMPVPSGTYTVTLRFREPDADTVPGRRIFTLKLDDRVVAERLDLAAIAGAGRTREVVVTDHRVTNGQLHLAFEPFAGRPCIAAIEVTGTTEVGHAAYGRRINCGGPAGEGYEADQLPGDPRPDEHRAMPVDAFYRDFAVAQFGPEAGPVLGRIFARLDGRLPQVVEWNEGPGAIRRNPEPWSALAPAFAFVDEFAAARPLVRGPGDRERFDYWLTQFQFYRELAHIGCAAGAFDREMQTLAADPNPARQRSQAREVALPARLALAREWTELLRLAVAGADTSGELGLIADLEQHTRAHLQFLSRHDAELERLLSVPLPAAAQPSDHYAGPPRIIVPTARTSAAPGEALNLKVILVGPTTPTIPALFWRPMGRGSFARLPFKSVGRGVFRARLPALTESAGAIEYYVEADFGAAGRRYWPATAPGLSQTVIVQDN